MGNIIMRAFGVELDQEEEEEERESRLIERRFFVLLLLAYLLAWIYERIENQTHYDSADEDHD